ncbi:MAG TPA: LSM domain-containing protein [Candidatus Thermoplasmatota archaeon]
MTKPLDALQTAIGKPVTVALRPRSEVRGVLDGFDPHMNLVLSQASRTVEGEEVSKHARTVVRGDSVVYISRIEAGDAGR